MKIMRRLEKKQILATLVVLLAFGGGFWAGYDYKANEIRKAFSDALNGDSSEVDDAEVNQEIENEDIEYIDYKIGDTIEYATQNMKVISVKSSTSVSSQYSSPVVADEGTKFVLITHSVTNTTESPYPYEAFVLIDNKKRLYNENSDTVVTVDNYFTGRELSPDVPETGVTIYKVPADATEFSFGGRKGQTNEFHGVKITIE